MIADILYVLCALVAVFIPMGFAWAIVRWTTRHRLDSDNHWRGVPPKLHPLRHAKARHPLRRVQSDTHRPPRSQPGE